MGREEGRIFPYCSSGHECMCVRAHVQFCLRSYGTRLVCGFLRGKQRLMRTRLCLLTDYSARFGEQDGEKKLNNKCCNPWNKKGKKKTETLVLLWGITKTFTGKQAQSGNSRKHFGGKSRHIWANLSGGAIKSSVGSHTEMWQEGPPGDELRHSFERKLLKQACQGMAFNTWCFPRGNSVGCL